MGLLVSTGGLFIHTALLISNYSFINFVIYDFCLCDGEDPEGNVSEIKTGQCKKNDV